MTVISGPRFVRSGRCRFFLIFAVVAVLIFFVSIFNNTQERQQELGEMKALLLRCKDDKLKIEKDNNEQDEIKQREESSCWIQLREQFEKSDFHEKLVRELNQTLQEVREQLRIQTISAEGHLAHWRRLSILLKEKEDELKNDRNAKAYKLLASEKAAADACCQAKQSGTNNKPLLPVAEPEPVIRSNKSFSAQVAIQPGVYQLTTNNGTTSTAKVAEGNANMKQNSVINSVENFQILPKPVQKVAPELNLQLKSPKSTAAEQGHGVGAAVIVVDKHKTPANSLPNTTTHAQHTKSASGGSSSLPPLAVPPKQTERKLPENVAPIPENFERAEQQLANPKDKSAAQHEEPAANSRYGSVISTAEAKPEDGGVRKSRAEAGQAQEVIDEHNSFFDHVEHDAQNLPNDDDKLSGIDLAAGGGGVGGEVNNEDELVGNINVGAGGDDLPVKQSRNLHSADSLNNEIVGDQGKELPDFQVGEGEGEGNDEDANDDDDDYPNIAARLQADKAIRN